MILVTGSSGFIGSRILNCLSGEAIGLQRSCYGNSNHDIIHCDLASLDNYNYLFDKLKLKHITGIVHAAAVTPWSDNVNYHSDEVMANFIVRLCNELHIESLYYISGWNVYDMSVHGAPYNETTPLKSLNEYGKSKIVVESIFARGLTDTKLVNLRLSSIYGKGQKSPGLISNLVHSAFNDNLIHLNSSDIKRDYLNIDDLCSAINKIIKLDNSSFRSNLNIGSGLSISIYNVAVAIQSFFRSEYNIKIDIECSNDVLDDVVKDNQLDTNKARELNLLNNTKSFDDGIAEYIRWVKNENIL